MGAEPYEGKGPSDSTMEDDILTLSRVSRTLDNAKKSNMILVRACVSFTRKKFISRLSAGGFHLEVPIRESC